MKPRKSEISKQLPDSKELSKEFENAKRELRYSRAIEYFGKNSDQRKEELNKKFQNKKGELIKHFGNAQQGKSIRSLGSFYALIGAPLFGLEYLSKNDDSSIGTLLLVLGASFFTAGSLKTALAQRKFKKIEQSTALPSLPNKKK
jgi:hypothetical protein